jgi:hypothetical protein
MKQSVSIVSFFCALLTLSLGQLHAQHYQKNWEKLQQGQWPAEQAKTYFSQVPPSDPSYAHALLVYGDLLLQETKKAARPGNYSQALTLADSAIVAYTKALQNNEPGTFKKNKSFFLEGFEEHVQKLPLKAQWSLVQEAIDRKVHQMERWRSILLDAREQHQLYQKNHLLAQLCYQELLETTNTPGKKRSFHEAFQQLADSLIRYQTLSHRHAGHVEEALKKIKGPAHSIPVQVMTVETLPAIVPSSTDLLVIDYTQWIEALKGQHQQEAMEFLEGVLSFWDSLALKKMQLEQTEQAPDLSNYQIPGEVLAFLVETEQEPLQITLFFQYLASWIRVQAQFRQEAQFLRYTSHPEAIIQYYFQLMELAQRTKNLMEMLKEAERAPTSHFRLFADQAFGGMEAFRAIQLEEETDLAQKERYCQIRLKDQLVMEHLENKFIPKYAWYENKAVPLFEQPLYMAVEPSHFVTTEVVKLPEGGMVVTGFQRNKRKEAFIAKIIHKEVVWLKNIHADAGNATGETDSYGMTLVAQKGTYAVVIQYTNSKGEVWNHLREFRENGQLQHACTLPNNYPTETLLKHGEGYLIVFQKEKNGKAIKETWLEFISKQGQSLWKNPLPVNSALTALIARDHKIYVTTNMVAPRDSNGMPLKNNKDKSNPYLAIFSEQGELLFQHQFHTRESYFITKVVMQEDGDLLLMGFLGNFNLNEIQDMPIGHIVYQPTAHRVQSDLSGIQKDWENTYRGLEWSPP